jgi:dTDP-4-dehydrorhamnose reductase
MNVLVTGAKGQLGKTLQKLNRSTAMVFAPSSELDITNYNQVQSVISENKFDFCINCAAYTNVELAEDEPEKAFLVNAEAVKNLAAVCKKNQVKLIHISTDYVFDGKKNTPYLETDYTRPLNVYGSSKLKGEKYIEGLLPEHFIIRTSWLYSKEFGKNFYKFIESVLRTNTPVAILNNQFGSPTKTDDLAQAIFEIIAKNSCQYGLYHYAGGGVCSWFDFAKEIAKTIDLSKEQLISSTDFFKTKALRSPYSKLDTSKIEGTFQLEILNWKKALKY